MKDNETWAKEATRLVKYVMLTKNVNYIELAQKLEEIGVVDTPKNLNNKIQRGTFSAILLLQILQALEVSELNLTAVRT